MILEAIKDWFMCFFLNGCLIFLFYWFCLFWNLSMMACWVFLHTKMVFGLVLCVLCHLINRVVLFFHLTWTRFLLWYSKQPFWYLFMDLKILESSEDSFVFFFLQKRCLVFVFLVWVWFLCCDLVTILSGNFFWLKCQECLCCLICQFH